MTDHRDQGRQYTNDTGAAESRARDALGNQAKKGRPHEPRKAKAAKGKKAGGKAKPSA